MIEIKSKNRAIAVAAVLGVLMLFSVILSITTASADAATTQVYLTVDETTAPQFTEQSAAGTQATTVQVATDVQGTSGTQAATDAPSTATSPSAADLQGATSAANAQSVTIQSTTSAQSGINGGKSSSNSTVQTGRTICIFAVLALGLSLALTACLERKRRINEFESQRKKKKDKTNIIYFDKEN